MQAGNICKDTKILTVLDIEGYTKDDIIDLCGHLITPDENAVHLCNKFLKLPNYNEMSKLWDKHTEHKNENKPIY